MPETPGRERLKEVKMWTLQVWTGAATVVSIMAGLIAPWVWPPLGFTLAVVWLLGIATVIYLTMKIARKALLEDPQLKRLEEMALEMAGPGDEREWWAERWDDYGWTTLDDVLDPMDGQGSRRP